MKALKDEIMLGKKQHIRFSELASGGPLHIRMLRSTTDLAMYVKEYGSLLEGMRFL
jgi:hypothetical protein